MTDHSRSQSYAHAGAGSSSQARAAYREHQHPAQLPSSSSSSHLRSGHDTSYASRSESDMFDDAPDEHEQWVGQRGNEPSASTLSSYGSHHQQQLHSPYNGAYHPSPNAHSPNMAGTPERVHNASMSSSLRGKRAPAPAALDLSPPHKSASASAVARDRTRQSALMYGDESGEYGGYQASERSQYLGLGLGMPGDGLVSERRAVTEEVQRRASRPLPHPPPPRNSSISSISLVPPSSAQTQFPQAYRTNSGDSSHTFTTSMLGPGNSAGSGAGAGNAAVPLSAVGLPGQAGMRHMSVSYGAQIRPGAMGGTGGPNMDRRPSEITVGGSERPSLDSYYFTSDPHDPDRSPDLDAPGAYTSRLPARRSIADDGDREETTTSPGFTPITPSMPDPFTLDRAGLIGTGELATPRWATSNLHPNLRTPAMPNLALAGTSPGAGVAHNSGVPQTAGVGDRGWNTGRDGVGLGVGMSQGQNQGHGHGHARQMSASISSSFGLGKSPSTSNAPPAATPTLHTSSSTSNFTPYTSSTYSPSKSKSHSQIRRERAMSQHISSPPRLPAKSEYRGSTGPGAAISGDGNSGQHTQAPSAFRQRDASLPRLTHAGSFQELDFSFDSGMEAAISAAFDKPSSAAGLGLAGTRAAMDANDTPRGNRQSISQPPQPLDVSSSGFANTSSSSAATFIAPAPYSPNSARARTAARKAERERRISGLQEAAQLSAFTQAIPDRSSSKLTPPNSAPSIDSMYAARQREREVTREKERERDSRKTPPNTANHGYGYNPQATSTGAHAREMSAPALSAHSHGPTTKGKHSPSGTSHHDILRHFAPKDFSHLPPSPSSASINQFLRNSNSTGNFGASGSGSGFLGSPSATTGKTPPTTSTSHISYFPSTSVNSTGHAPPTPSAGVYKAASTGPSGIGMVRSDSQRSNRLKVDRDTAEAMRKLDGLGSTPKGSKISGSRGSKMSSRSGSPVRERKNSAASLNAGSGAQRPSLAPPPSAALSTGAAERNNTVSSPLSKWTDIMDETNALIGDSSANGVPMPNGYGAQKIPTANGQVSAGLDGPHMRAARRESPSTASFEGTPTSRDSTSITTPSSSSARPDLKQRRASAGSDFSTAGSDNGPHNASGSFEKVGELSVPPVPPLPKGYASMRHGLSNAASMPPPTAPIQPAYQPIIDHSYAPTPAPASASAASVSTPIIHSSPVTSVSPASTTTTGEGHQRPKPANKKWSFSSAISLRLGKDPASANASTSSPPQVSPNVDRDRDRSTDLEDQSYNWSQSQAYHPDISMMSASSASHATFQNLGQARHAGSDSSSATASRIENRSVTSITPVGLVAPAPVAAASKPPPTNKRLTPSGIPFFRRTSSSSTQPKQPTPPAEQVGGKSSLPPVSKIPTLTSAASSGNTRKSMLGMHFPSMLRSSGSKRHLSQQAPASSAQEHQDYVNIGADQKAAASGWGNRARGKTMSISGPLEPKVMSPSNNQNQYEPRSATLRPKASDSSLRSGNSYVHESGSQTLRASKSGLPPISGSPAIKPQASVGSLRTNENRAPQAPTPTRIPRLGSRNPSPAVGAASMSMGPPPAPGAQTISHSRSVQLGGGSKTIASTSSVNDFSRANASISEFGAIGGPKAQARNPPNDPQRSRLLAPMSMRNEPKPRQFAKPAEPAQRIDRPSNIPPSRRTMPLPPSAAAMTISAQAKRVSRDVKPGLSRHSSKEGVESGRTSRDEAPSPIKPSKSLHAKLNVPSASSAGTTAGSMRIPSSSSVGAPVAGLRKVSLATTTSATPSPAEDEETLADQEMAAYVARRKARVAAGTGRKDDLKDIEGFPEDIEPAQPISQRTYISKNLARMTDYERKEALDYDEIYFIPRVPIIREPQKGGVLYNYGYDDERGDYLVVEGDHICYRYEVMGVLGKGSFGQVLQCRDHKTGKSVAVKIIRNKKRFHAQAMVETKILGQLVEWDPEDKHYMVCMTDHFNFRSHLCIVTELLSINLYELIKANQFAGFSTTLIRRFTMQMLSSLQLMRSHRIVHCDLKPENILLKHPCKSGIKVIDFGSSCHETEKVYTYIQSRFYRSPEVILGMNYAMAIDMWSLGCILAELYTGVPIFPGENEHEQLACIMEILGVPDTTIINKAQRKKLFFDTSGAPRPFVNAKGKRRRPGSKTLAQALKCKDDLFIDFISKCLTWDPDRRLKPQPAMRHPWILAGRRRYAPPPTGPTHRLSERTSISGSASSGATPLAHARVPSSGLKSGSISGSASTAVPSALSSTTAALGERKSYIISPPTPLVAKNGYGQVQTSAPKLGYGAPPRVINQLNTRSSFIGSSKMSYD